MERVEGNKTESQTKKEKGNVTGHEASHCGSGVIAEHCSGEGLQEIGFKAGRTIELRRFEFCRISLGIRVRVPRDMEPDLMRDALEDVVLQLVAREEGAVAGTEYTGKASDVSLEAISKGVCRNISVGYGLTLKSGSREYESYQVDLIEHRPVSDSADLLAEFEVLSEEMAAYLDKQHKRIKGIGSDTGI
jgi:hypothetical protein